MTKLPRTTHFAYITAYTACGLKLESVDFITFNKNEANCHNCLKNDPARQIENFKESINNPKNNFTDLIEHFRKLVKDNPNIFKALKIALPPQPAPVKAAEPISFKSYRDPHFLKVLKNK